MTFSTDRKATHALAALQVAQRREENGVCIQTVVDPEKKQRGGTWKIILFKLPILEKYWGKFIL